MNSFSNFLNDLHSFSYYNVSRENDISDIQLQQLSKYYDLLIEWNNKMNLTSIIEWDEVLKKHFIDSISIINSTLFQNMIGKDISIIDIGTGAGFPGIPLKIMFPNINMTLIDSLGKRVTFLNEVIEQLGLDGIEAFHGRAEDFAKDANYREQYDICVSRAVANLSTLSEYCIPFVKMNGYFIPYKSGHSEDEMNESRNAISILGGVMEDHIDYNLPNSDISRSLYLIKKEKCTPKKYPRKAGLPSKDPL